MDRYYSYLDEPAQSIIDAIDAAYMNDSISVEEATALSDSIPEYIAWLQRASAEEKLERYRRLIESEEDYDRRIAVDGEPQWYLNYLSLNERNKNENNQNF